MNEYEGSDPIEEMVRLFPNLLEIYPLERFLDAILRKLQELTGSDTIGCWVAEGQSLAIRRRDQMVVALVSKETATHLQEERNDSISVKLLTARNGEALLADRQRVTLVDCRILSRSVGRFLIPVGAKVTGPMQLLARLTGYYLHRNEAERRFGDYAGAPVLIMGSVRSIFELQEDVERFAPLREPVLVLGESGSGKEIFAQMVHVLSPRRSGAFVALNCAATPSESLLLDDFFGHRRGAFTGAAFDKVGSCQEADGGTLFLDEIGDMSHELQTLLLRTLTTGEVRRIGDPRSTRVDIRVVSATHRDLLARARERLFRSDLYYRISAFQLHLPPLRARLSDIRNLANYILFHFAQVNKLPLKTLTEAAWTRLLSHSWPGNVRELENVLKRAFVTARSTSIDVVDLRIDSANYTTIDNPNDQLLAEMRDAGRSFWNAVAEPFTRREITRADVALLIENGLTLCNGQLKRLSELFNIGSEEYGRFVAFLHRHGFRGKGTWPARRGVSPSLSEDSVDARKDPTATSGGTAGLHSGVDDD